MADSGLEAKVSAMHHPSKLPLHSPRVTPGCRCFHRSQRLAKALTKFKFKLAGAPPDPPDAFEQEEATTIPPPTSWDVCVCIAAFVYFQVYSFLSSSLLEATWAACIAVQLPEETVHYLRQDFRVRCDGGRGGSMDFSVYHLTSVVLLITCVVLPPVAIAAHISHKASLGQLDQPSMRYRWGFL